MDATHNIACQILPFTYDINSSDFDQDFVWGTATSAFQIEGAAAEGGRAPSLWDAYCLKRPDRIVGGDNANTACNAYYKIKEDVQTMKKIGLKAYRFSLSWSRILPGGKLSMGINQEGVDYYNNLINELIANDIDPYVTLWHWDTPNALEEEYMGFLDEKIICDYMLYAEFCFWEFGDRVKHWITVNEPHQYSSGGYAVGSYAPGRGGRQVVNSRALSPDLKSANLGVLRVSGNIIDDANGKGRVGKSFDRDGPGDPGTEPYLVAHHLILSHASAVKLYRERFKESQGGVIGITLDSTFYEPLDPHSNDDKNAALRALDFMFGWFMEPIYKGKYPDVMIKLVGSRLPKFSKDQIELIKGSFDFIGLNYYIGQYATTSDKSDIPSYITDSMVHEQAQDLHGNDIGEKGGAPWFWSYPIGIYKLLIHLKELYGDPLIYITENGWPDAANSDLTVEQARVDAQRMTYFNNHLRHVRDAISSGCRVKGYFAWSFMDNFEWAVGYTSRFGLFYVDFKNGNFTRYPKNSAIWFKNFLTYNEKKSKTETKKRLAGSPNTETTKRTRK